MPVDGPGKLAIGIRTGLCHLFQPQIHAHAHEGRHQFEFLYANRCVFTREVREVAQKSGPIIDFEQQIGQWQMRQQRVHTLFQAFNFFRYGFFQLGKMEMSFVIQGQAPFDFSDTLL